VTRRGPTYSVRGVSRHIEVLAQPSRRTFSAGRDAREEIIRANPRSASLEAPHGALEHRAIVLRADGQPISEVCETCTKNNREFAAAAAR
jgi:hypothetical protein